MADGTPLTLYGRITLRATIDVLTGLHVGTAYSGLGLGGVDLPIVRDQVSSQPYLPGSSLRGKMRSLTERVLGLPLNTPVGRARIHSPQTRAEYDASPLGRLYGVPGSLQFSIDAPTRLVVRDVFLTDESRTALAGARTDLPYSELKAEVAIDRVTAEAVARQVERLPAGARLGPAELVYSVYEGRDLADFGWVARGLQLVEDDYLGGHGSRGSGRVRFVDLSIGVKSRAVYRGEGGPVAERSYPDLAALAADLGEIESWLRSALAVPA